MRLNFKLKQRIMENFGTQYDFAEHIGVHHTIVSLVINGRRPLTKLAQKIWAEALETTVGELF